MNFTAKTTREWLTVYARIEVGKVIRDLENYTFEVDDYIDREMLLEHQGYSYGFLLKSLRRVYVDLDDRELTYLQLARYRIYSFHPRNAMARNTDLVARAILLSIYDRTIEDMPTHAYQAYRTDLMTVRMVPRRVSKT